MLSDEYAGIQLKTMRHSCETHGDTDCKIYCLKGVWSKPWCEQCEAIKTSAREEEDRKRAEEMARQERVRRIESYQRHSGIPMRFSDRKFENYTPDGNKSRAAMETCASYADDFPRMRRLGRSMILCGLAGTGKTHLACAIAHHIMPKHAASTLYMAVPRAFRSVKETYKKGADKTEQQVISSFKSPDLLILDEIGVQYGSDAERNILFEIINERYEALLPTILISNLAMVDLTSYAGERVIDRMKENGGAVLVFDWPSARGKQARMDDAA